MSDARFEDGGEQPLRLRAETPEDLAVISALVQDAVAQTSAIAWTPRRHRFTMLLKRFRWEDVPAAERQGRRFERVQALLTVDGALRARTNGPDPRAPETVIALLALGFDAGVEGAGVLRLQLAGDGEIALDVECLDVRLTDVSRPYLAQAKSAPSHRSD